MLLGIKQNVSHIFTKHLFLCILINSQDGRGSLHWVLRRKLQGRARGAWILKPGIPLDIQHSNKCRVLHTSATLLMHKLLACKPACLLGNFLPLIRMNTLLLQWRWTVCLSQTLCALWDQQTLTDVSEQHRSCCIWSDLQSRDSCLMVTKTSYSRGNTPQKGLSFYTFCIENSSGLWNLKLLFYIFMNW